VRFGLREGSGRHESADGAAGPLDAPVDEHLAEKSFVDDLDIDSLSG
jgi:hypothetical protein